MKLKTVHMNRENETPEQTVARLAICFRLQGRGFVATYPGGMLANGLAVLAVFPSTAAAKRTLLQYGFINPHANIWKVVR